MKKLISVLLIMTMVLSLTACGGKNTEETVENEEVVTDTATEETEDATEDETVTEDTTVEEENLEAEEPVANEVGQENSATEETTSSFAPQTKPEENTQEPADTTEQKPAEDTKKEEVVDDEEEVKEEASSVSLGQTLLAVFKDNAGSMGTQELADKLITNEAILFMGGAMPVEAGLLSGFDNAEITGFKEGTMFGPMMGSIAFVGYVFELEDGADVDAFKQNLKDNANPRWQICVAAEETIVESVGNKVFFLMCPTSLEQ